MNGPRPPSPPGDTAPSAAKPAARSHATLVYQLRRPLAELPDNLRLRNHEWGTLFAITGEHSCAQIAGLLGLDPAERDRTFSRLLACGLIEERPLSYGEYLRAVASWRDGESRSLQAFLRGGAAMPQGAPQAVGQTPGAPPAAPAPGRPPGVVTAPLPALTHTQPRPPAPPVLTADSDLNITRALPTFTRQQATAPVAGEAPAFQPLDDPPRLQAPAAGDGRSGGRGALSLKALMQHILGKASDPQSGQLDVYRVFIRIHSKLLQRNGITTLRFQEDRLIEDPELQSALVASFEKALGVPCPPEVFV